jgi:hypothetical protein
MYDQWTNMHDTPDGNEGLLAASAGYTFTNNSHPLREVYSYTVSHSTSCTLHSAYSDNRTIQICT